jgi:hypothetical protein
MLCGETFRQRLIEGWPALEAPLGAPDVAPAKARLTVRDAKGFHHGNTRRSKFFLPDFVAHRFAVSANG